RSSEHVAGNSSNSAGSGHWDGALGRLHGRHGRARLRFLYRTGTGWRAGGFVETHEQGCRSDFRERRRVGKELRGTAAQSSILIGERTRLASANFCRKRLFRRDAESPSRTAVNTRDACATRKYCRDTVCRISSTVFLRYPVGKAVARASCIDSLAICRCRSESTKT